jgi:hypothetical protein
VTDEIPDAATPAADASLRAIAHRLAEGERIESLFDDGLLVASDPAGRLELLLDVFRHLEHTGAAEVVGALAISSRYPTVRWKAVETLLELDTPSGLRALCRALRDQHAFVRHAAATRIESIGHTCERAA